VVNHTVLIAGGTGFLGSNLVRYWAMTHPHDRLISMKHVRTNVTCRLATEVQCDLADAEFLIWTMKRYQVSAVINCSGMSDSSLAIDDPTACFNANVSNTSTLLEASRQASVERYHQISSAEVYGHAEASSCAFAESAPLRPVGPYASSKAAADHIVFAYCEAYGLPVTVSTPTTVFGPMQGPEKLVPCFVINALLDRPLPLFDTGSTREWLHIADFCKCVDLAMTCGRPGARYNVGSGHVVSAEAIADMILNQLHKPATLKQVVPARRLLARSMRVDSSLARAELGWNPYVDFAAGLRGTIKWYLDNRDWWYPRYTNDTMSN
jgi:dTDP-glucose 4,6-dehydratase